VRLIAGPVALPTPWRVQREDVTTAREMDAAVRRIFDAMSASEQSRAVFVSVAAVADWRPEESRTHKIKKRAGQPPPSLRFTENPDILASVAARHPPPYCVGFAAESESLADHGEAKRRSKQVPLLAANIGPDTFGRDDNALLLMDDQGQTALPRASKEELAFRLVAEIAQRLGGSKPVLGESVDAAAMMFCRTGVRRAH
jgi:phosphopantothenoylcysteine decarboxylase/phosphopantothenate--cysteine ligase